MALKELCDIVAHLFLRNREYGLPSLLMCAQASFSQCIPEEVGYCIDVPQLIVMLMIKLAGTHGRWQKSNSLQIVKRRMRTVRCVGQSVKISTFRLLERIDRAMVVDSQLATSYGCRHRKCNIRNLHNLRAWNMKWSKRRSMTPHMLVIVDRAMGVQ